RDPPADQDALRRPDGDPVDAHPARGRAGVRQGRDHQRRSHHLRRHHRQLDARSDPRRGLPALHHRRLRCHEPRRGSRDRPRRGALIVRNILTIAGRELRSIFVSPIAYVVLTGFLLLGGWFFFNLLARFNSILTYYSMQQNPQVLQRLNLNEFVIAPLLHNLSVVLVILVPVITMRSLAEEKKAG